MRKDEVIFDGKNPFDNFVKCKELTVLLAEDRVVFVGTVNSINIMITFNSVVSTSEIDGEKVRDAYSIPLSLLLPLFRLDTKEKENTLIIETHNDKATITYNGVSVDTDIFSPNGLTLQQIDRINISESMEVSPFPFTNTTDLFGVTKDNFCNVDGKTIFIADESKCLIFNGEIDYGRKFSLSIPFIKLMKSMECTKLYLGENVVAETKNGLWIVTNLTKLTDSNVLMDYKFASRIKSDNIYNLGLRKYLRQINVASQSGDLDVKLNLDDKKLIFTSNNNEMSEIQLEDTEITKEGDFDFFGDSAASTQQITLNDSKLLKSLASFNRIRLKVCDSFLLARLDEKYRLLFTLGRG